MPTVRTATPSDLPRIIEIAAGTPDSAQWPPDEYAKFFSADAASRTVQHHAFLVAEDEEMVQGFVVGRGIGDEWEIENIAVIPSAQRCGMGRMLLTGFLRMVHESGAASVFLEVRESNRAARLLYEKAGFAEVGRRKGYYRNPSEDAAVLKISFFLSGRIFH